MVEVDYDKLADFGGFDGHTPCLILFGIEHPWGKPLRAFHLPDAVLKTVKEAEADLLKIIETRMPEAFTRSCGIFDTYGRLICLGRP